MTSENHTLTFYGEILPGHDPKQVRMTLAKLLGLPEQDCDHVFSGQRVVLKRNLAAADSARYLAHLEKIGIRATVESEPVPQPAASVPVPAAPPALAPRAPAAAVLTAAPADEMTCPKCGERQPKRTLCRSCATDMPRFLAAQQQEATEALELKKAGLDGSAVASRIDTAADDSEDRPAWVDVSFEGRLGRIDYLCAGMLFTALATLGVFAAFKLHSIGFGAVVGLATLFVSLRIVALRCHDIGLTGWAALIVAIPYVGALMSLLLLLFPGDRGGNYYGSQPRRARNGILVGVASLVVTIALANTVFRQVVAMQLPGRENTEVAADAPDMNASFAADNRVIFYAAPDCPCKQVRDALENMGISAQLRVIEIDLTDDEQDALYQRIVAAGLPTNPTRLPIVDVNGVLLEDPPPEAIIARLRVQK